MEENNVHSVMLKYYYTMLFDLPRVFLKFKAKLDLRGRVKLYYLINKLKEKMHLLSL